MGKHLFPSDQPDQKEDAERLIDAIPISPLRMQIILETSFVRLPYLVRLLLMLLPTSVS